jgi:hypothetical protein
MLEIQMNRVVAIGVACALFAGATPAVAQSKSSFSDIAPQAVGCAYTFTSGSGVNLFTWCLSVNGNVMKLETPAGQNHHHGGTDGYAVCSATGTHGADFGLAIPVAFGPPTIVSGCTTGSTCTIQRDTSDGVFRLIQKFSQVTKEKELNIDHTLINLTGAAVADVVLTRLTHFGVNNKTGDDRGDKSARSAWLADVDRVSSTASTFIEPATVFIVNTIPTGCDAAAVATPAPPGNYAHQINYKLGTLGPLKKKIVRVQIRRD